MELIRVKILDTPMKPKNYNIELFQKTADTYLMEWYDESKWICDTSWIQLKLKFTNNNLLINLLIISENMR